MCLHRPVIGTVVTVLQDVDAHHQTNGFAVPTNGAVVNRQGFVDAIPLDDTGGAQKFMLQIENIHNQGLEHRQLLTGYLFSYQQYTADFQGNINPFQQLSSTFKELAQCSHRPEAAFFRTD